MVLWFEAADQQVVTVGTQPKLVYLTHIPACHNFAPVGDHVARWHLSIARLEIHLDGSRIGDDPIRSTRSDGFGASQVKARCLGPLGPSPFQPIHIYPYLAPEYTR